MQRLTQNAHDWIADKLQRGDIVVDCTAGNGHDTCFLSRAVGPSGLVYAIDIQQSALNQTRYRLKSEGTGSNTKCILGSHANLHAILPREHSKNISAIMFNLGYLPSGDHNITTQPESTCHALSQSISIIKPGGRMTVIAYPGHSVGRTELFAVTTWLENDLPTTADFTIANPDHPENSPVLFLIETQPKT